ncbi:hypothetical protein EDEG_01975 [Edhazardia aedis USNM 41457]|uniref:Uncharacterized protein n=1 Tax=Edhazardia aedis (strain USNM 41457) TaxID=1003232 RepID=J9DQY1_EDHAE|nr:hypothetical protein EDEG_01975 [Edhazardia aedis USNM 41457]|eukprot:EJW03737.1 hypothetical protein EDEG_01975 [Edhazardia aedis USNM 41457]
MQEREDLIVKKRMSNSVALAALGSKKFNWMDEASNSEKESVMESLYAPYDDKEFLEKVRDRTVTHEDFMYVLEHDKRYNKSIFTIGQYFNIN